MKKKKFLILGLSAMMFLGLASCSANENPTLSSSSSSEVNQGSSSSNSSFSESSSSSSNQAIESSYSSGGSTGSSNTESSASQGSSTNQESSSSSSSSNNYHNESGVTLPSSADSKTENYTTGIITQLNYGGDLEDIYANWKAKGTYEYFNCYYMKENSSTWVKIDNELVRTYNGYYRADFVGLAAGKYSIKIVPTLNGSELADDAVTVQSECYAHTREGFAFVNGTSTGAYDSKGELNKDAVVLYLTDSNKDTMSCEVVTSSKGATTVATGIQNILNLIKKGYDNRSFAIRMIGNVTTPNCADKGDLVIDSSKKVTFEGIGNDATCNGFGIRIKGCSNVEVRNLGFMNCNSSEGDNVGLQQDNDHIWVHNCDMFYGDAGSDADQAKGDGALDTKKSNYVTLSYNHFYDNGKCNLLGLSENDHNLYISYHHNWYDHSDSRHPRVRFYNAHVYNNFYDGNAKYGMGACLGSSIFSEANYFKNCKFPMLTSMQGHDVVKDWTTLERDVANMATFSKEDGGSIKSYGNRFEGTYSLTTYQQNNAEFDCYEVTNRYDMVPDTVKSYSGGNTYSNFDTKDTMYQYSIQTPEAAVETIKAFSGRVQGGDFKWTFTDADNTSYSVIQELKNAIVNYKSGLVSIANGAEIGGGVTNPDVEIVSVDELINKIDALPQTVTLNDESTITEVYNQYLALAEADKGRVTNSAKLIAAYQDLSNQKVQNVINKIQALTDDSTKDEVMAVNDLYTKLTDNEKTKVTNADTLKTYVAKFVTVITYNFNDGAPAAGSFFTITGNYSTSKGTVTYDGNTISKCLKMESSTNVSFTLDVQMTLTLVFEKAGKVYIDGTAYNAQSDANGNYVVVVTLNAGAHSITKGDSLALFYIKLEK